MSEVENAWVWNRTIGNVLRQTAQQNPTRDALVFPRLRNETTVSEPADGLHVSYAQYDRLVDEAAKSLMALGVYKGDHIASGQPTGRVGRSSSLPRHGSERCSLPSIPPIEQTKYLTSSNSPKSRRCSSFASRNEFADHVSVNVGQAPID